MGFDPGGVRTTRWKSFGKIWYGRCTVYDADMEGCFDSIPHDKLIACVRMRVVDGSVLRLIKQWLRAPVEEKDENGRPRRRRNDKGNATRRSSVAAVTGEHLSA